MVTIMMMTWSLFETGRDYKVRFVKGLQGANPDVNNVYNYKVKGNGPTAEYILCSEKTKEDLVKWFKYEKCESSTARIKKKLTLLRNEWTTFMKYPQRHVDRLFQVIWNLFTFYSRTRQ
jgi:hypothetical protein